MAVSLLLGARLLSFYLSRITWCQLGLMRWEPAGHGMQRRLLTAIMALKSAGRACNDDLASPTMAPDCDRDYSRHGDTVQSAVACKADSSSAPASVGPKVDNQHIGWVGLQHSQSAAARECSHSAISMPVCSLSASEQAYEQSQLCKWTIAHCTRTLCLPVICTSAHL